MSFKEEMEFLSSVAICEQGTAGAYAELELMSNLFELQTRYTTLYDYVKNSGWFACARSSHYTHNTAAVDQVKETLVIGNRVLPLYINEHDCKNCNSKKLCHNTFKGDICTLKIDSTEYKNYAAISNKENYIKDKTIITNVYGSVYTFYTFPCKNCDPFGYTASAKATYDRLNNNS